MSARGPMHLRRSLFAAACIVAFNAFLLLASYSMPSLQSHQRIRTMVQPQSTRTQLHSLKETAMNVSMVTVTMTGCSKAADWQAMGLYYSFLRCKPMPALVMHSLACCYMHRYATCMTTWAKQSRTPKPFNMMLLFGREERLTCSWCVFLSCTANQLLCSSPEWKSMQLNFRRSGQPGRFLRIAACLPGEGKPTALVPTWTTEGVLDVGHIQYPLFNKPWALSKVRTGILEATTSNRDA